MTSRKTERILNLTICLLVSGRYLPKSQIREAVEGYHDLVRHRVRAHLRAGQGRAAGAGRPDRGRLLRPVLRRRARLPDQAVGVRAAAGRAGRRRGRRGRGRGPGLAARQRGRVHPERAGQAASRRGRAGHLPARRAGTVGAGPRGGVRAAVDGGAGSRPGVVHLPRRRQAHPGAVGDDRLEGPLVRDRLGHRPAGHPDVQADPDHRQAAAGVQGRAPTRCPRTSTCARWPARWLPGAEPDGTGRRPRRARVRRSAAADTLLEDA